jgi:hypothetical protein
MDLGNVVALLVVVLVAGVLMVCLRLVSDIRVPHHERHQLDDRVGPDSDSQ